MPHQKRKTKSLTLIGELQKRSRECHEAVRSTFRLEKIEYAPLRKALEHYFSYWNDYTHPGLFSIAYEASGGKSKKALGEQAAIAMIAAGFDIHDDIIDRSTEKHGYPTVFGKFGQDLALLLGNAFMINGLTHLELSILDLPNAVSTAIIETVKNCLFEVGNAHALELAFRRSMTVSAQRYLEILEMKSASIEADMHVAALVASGKSEESETLRSYGRILGTLATLREEFVDIFDIAELKRRLREETLPIPLMFVMQQPEARMKIMEKLEKTRLDQDDLEVLLDLVFQSEPVNELKRKMGTLCSEAQSLADRTENRKSRDLLNRLATSMLEDL
jgi:geranylgeranyl pyrophosphate synthase